VVDTHAMSVFLVRHGETALNAALIVQPEDTPLNENGRSQAQALALRLQSMNVTRVVSSDLLRARMTAELVAGAVQLPVETSGLLAERNFGALRGTPYAELSADLFAQDFVPPGGETWAQFYARVGAAFEHIVDAARTTEGNLVVITHGLVCRAVIERHLTLRDGASPLGSCANTSVTIFDGAPPYVATLINCTVHLRDGELARGAV
jgi:broad specificity phosphatase PhoE